MGVAAPVSLDSYLAHPTEPESEYCNGELFQKAMGSKPHSRLQQRLILLLNRYEQEGWGQVSVEQSVQLDEKTILIPDVCLLQPDDAAANLVTAPPVLCIEILSLSDRFSFMVRKCQAYRGWGVSACWILDPESKQGWVSNANGLCEISSAGTFEAGPVRLSMSEVFPAKP